MSNAGEIDQAGLRRKNGFLREEALRNARIVAVGNRRWEDID